MQRSGIISMENLFEVKAPLASFDTVDLGDEDKIEDKLETAIEFMPVTPEESLAESVDSQSSNTSQNVESQAKCETSSIVDNTEAALSSSVSELQHCYDETDSVKGENTGTTGSNEANSSENNAVGSGDILQRLKLKSKKYKETESNVKYQQIDNNSDLSDHEKSSLQDFKLVSAYKFCDSDTDSSDSDSGYLRSGYIAALKGSKKVSKKKNKISTKIKEKYDFSTPESTPNASPKVFRPILPPPLTEEERAQQSKRKAYEKRLQRLQVTTAPIERPRSTTPIDIFGLEEYAHISSPEKTPQPNNLEKLKITLPADEFHLKGHSPRKSSRTSDSHDPRVFMFNEDLLFTHTKSALVVQDDMKTGQSPRRILIPPTLSPALSPRSQRSSTALNLSPRSPRYYYTPKSTSVHPPPSQLCENWAKFEDDIPKEAVKQGVQVSNAPSVKENMSTDSFDLIAKDKMLSEEEILTVNIEVVNETKVCDIKCESIAKGGEENTSYGLRETQTIIPTEFSSKDPEHKNEFPVFANVDKEDSTGQNSTADKNEDIWMAHECSGEYNIKTEQNLAPNTENTVGEANTKESDIEDTIKTIVDNAFREETFKLDFDEKDASSDTALNEAPVTDTTDRKIMYVTDRIDKISPQW